MDGVSMVKHKARVDACDVLLAPHNGVPGHIDADVPPLLVQIAKELKGTPADAAANFQNGHVGRKTDILFVVLNLRFTDPFKRLRPRAGERYKVARNLEALELGEPIDRRNTDRTPPRDRHAHIAPCNRQRWRGCLGHDLELVPLFKRKGLKLLRGDQEMPCSTVDINFEVRRFSQERYVEKPSNLQRSPSNERSGVVEPCRR